MPANSRPARNSHSQKAQSVDGLDDLYIEEISAQKSTKHQPARSKGTAQRVKRKENTTGWLSVEEAAKRLDITPNAVIKRLGKATLAGQKVPGKFGDRWLVDPNKLPLELRVEVVDSMFQKESAYSRGTAFNGEAQPAPDTPGNPEHSELVVAKVTYFVERIESLNREVGELKTLLDEQRRENQNLKLLTDRRSRGFWASLRNWLAGALNEH